MSTAGTGLQARLAPGLPLQPGFDREARAAARPGVDAPEPEEDPERDAHAPRHRHPVAAGEYVEDGLVDPEVIARVHEEIEERRLVVLVDELEQRGKARVHPALVGREAPGREVTGAERLENGGSRQLARAQRDVDAA